MLGIRTTVGYIGLVTISMACLAGTEWNVQTRLMQVREVYEKQREMFGNMRFKADWLQPHVQVRHEPGKPPDQIELIDVPDEKILNVIEYHTDKAGRYVLSTEQHVVDAASGEIKSKSHSSQYSFNGQTYRAFYSEHQASIFTPEQRFDTGRSLIKPTYFMDHLFDEDLSRALDHPENVRLSETADGLWLLEYHDEKAQYSYIAALDPKQDFVVIESKRTSKDGHVYTKKTEFKKTEEGFWYPVKGHRSFDGKNELTMNVTEFELNAAEGNYTLEFPKGTHVRDYTRRANPPEVYRYGQAKKSFEQIVQGGGKFVTGEVFGETGSPVADVLVRICCHKTPRADGRFSFTFSGNFDIFNAVTDEKGRFAIELEEEGQYNLLFSPKSYAAMIVYDVPAGKADLQVTLSKGGTITGRLLRIEDGEKVPVPSAEVKIEQEDRSSYSHLGFDRDRTAVTDAQGKFRFDHIQTKIRDFRTSKSEQWEYTPRVWKISHGATSKTFAFYEGTKIDDMELIAEPDYANPVSLMGKPLPSLNGIKIDLSPERAEGKILLFCFFDMNQRPSRNCIMHLAKNGEDLKQKNATVFAIQCSQMDENKLAEWMKTNEVPFPAGMIRGDAEKTKYIWGVTSLPWLILADREHIARAEGFGIDELDEKIKEITDEKR